MKQAALIVSVTIALALSVTAQDRSPYVGYNYEGIPPGKVLPNGIKHLGGGLIGDFNKSPVYGVSQVQRGRSKMLWLEVSTGRDRDGIPSWRVLDVITFAPARSRDHILIDGDPAVLCRRRGKAIPNLVGIGRIQRHRRSFLPSSLWVADLRSKKFKPLAVRGITCVYSEP